MAQLEHHKQHEERRSRFRSIMGGFNAGDFKQKEELVEHVHTFLRELQEAELSPVDVFGARTCAKTLHVIIEHFVEGYFRSSAKKNQSTTRRVAQHLEMLCTELHYRTGFDNLVPPLAISEGKIFSYLLHHMLSIFNNDIVASECGSTYCKMLLDLLRYRVYWTIIPEEIVQQLVVKICELIVTLKNLELAAVWGELLTQLVKHPFVQARPDDEVKELHTKLMRAINAMHTPQCTESKMEIHALLMSAATELIKNCAHSHKKVVCDPFSSFSGNVKFFIDLWHLAKRRDKWRVAVAEFISTFVSAIFAPFASGFFYTQSAAAVEQQNLVSTLAVKMLHKDLVPMVFSILIQIRSDFTLVGLKEMGDFPCKSLHAVFEMCAFVLFFAQITVPKAAELAITDSEIEQFVEIGERREEDEGSNLLPLKSVGARLVAELSAELKRAERDESTDVACFVGHCIGNPIATCALPFAAQQQIAVLIRELLKTGRYARSCEDVLLAALTAVVPACKDQTVRKETFCWCVQHYIPTAGNEAEDALPKVWAYKLLAALVSVGDSDTTIVPASCPIHLSSHFFSPKYLLPSVAEFLKSFCHFHSHDTFSQNTIVKQIVGNVAQSATPKLADEYFDLLKVLCISVSHGREGKQYLPPPHQVPNILKMFFISSHEQQVYKSRTPSLDLDNSNVQLVISSFTGEIIMATASNNLTLIGAAHLWSILLQLFSMGLWRAPTSREDINLICLSRAHSVAASITTRYEQLAASLTSNGSAYFALVLVADFLKRNLPRCDHLADSTPLEALVEMMRTVGSTLTHPKICVADELPQDYLSSLSTLGGELLEVAQKASLSMPARWETATVALNLCFEFETLLYTAVKDHSEILEKTRDPLADGHQITRQIVQLLDNSQLLTFDSNDKLLYPVPRVFQNVVAICRLLTRLDYSEGHVIVMALLKNIFTLFLPHAATEYLKILSFFDRNSAGTSPIVTQQAARQCKEAIQFLFDKKRYVPPQIQAQACSAIAALIPWAEKEIDMELTRTLFSFCTSQYLVVRTAAVECSIVPFTSFHNTLKVFNSLLKAIEGVHQIQVRSKYSSIMSLFMQLSTRVPLTEPFILSSLLEQFASRNFEHKPVVLDVIDELAAINEFKDKRSFMGCFASQLACDWIWEYKYPLSAFPTACFGFDTLFELCSCYSANILPFALMTSENAENNDALIKLIDMTKTDLRTLIRNGFSQILGSLIALCFCGKEDVCDAAKQAIERIKSEIGTALFSDYIKSNCVQITVELLERATESTTPRLPLITTGSLVEAVNYIAKAVGFSPASFLVWGEGVRLYQILLAVFAKMEQHAARRKSRAFVLKELIVSFLSLPVLTKSEEKDGGKMHFALEATLHIACCLIRLYAETRPAACAILCHIWEKKDAMAKKSVSEHFAYISSILLSVQDSCCRELHKWLTSLLCESVDLPLQRESSQQLLISVSQQAVEPAAVASSRASFSDWPIEDVVKVLPLAMGAPEAGYYRSVAATIDLKRSSLVEAMKKEKDLQPYHETARHLLNISSAVENKISLRAAALDAFRALWFALVESSEGATCDLSECTTIEWEPNFHATGSLVDSAYCFLLKQLSQFAFDGDAVIMIRASTVIMSLFENPSSQLQSALEKLRAQEDSAFERIFPFTKMSSVVASSNNRVKTSAKQIRVREDSQMSSFFELTNEELWNIGESDAEHDRFIRRFATSWLLSSHIAAPFLVDMAPLCDVSTSFAAACIPVILCTLAETASSISQINKFLSKKLLSSVFSPVRSPRVARLFLASINTVRVFVSKTKEKRVGTYWFNIPALELARVALVCGELHFTHIFLSLSCELPDDKGLLLLRPVQFGFHFFESMSGRKRSHEDNIDDALQRNAVKQKHIQEVFAVLHQLALKTKNDDLLEVIPHNTISDLGFNSSQVVSSHQQQDWMMSCTCRSVKGCSVGDKLECGRQMVEALHRSACFNLVEMAVPAILEGADDFQTREIKELQREAMWRQSLWGQLKEEAEGFSPQLLVNQSLDLFNDCIFYGLRALRCNDTRFLKSIVAKGQEIIAAQLAPTNFVESAVKLQMLRDLADARPLSHDPPAFCGNHSVTLIPEYSKIEALDNLRSIVLSMYDNPRWLVKFVGQCAERAQNTDSITNALLYTTSVLRSGVLSNLEDCPEKQNILFSHAELLKTIGDSDTAIALLQQADAGNCAVGVKLLSKHLAEAQKVPLSSIVRGPLTEFSQSDPGAALTLAVMHDTLLQSVVDRIPHLQETFATIQQSEETIRHIGEDRELKHRSARLVGECDRNRRLILHAVADWITHRDHAMLYYCQALAQGLINTADNLKAAFRFFLLWLEGTDIIASFHHHVTDKLRTDSKLRQYALDNDLHIPSADDLQDNKVVKENLKAIPTHVFVPLFTQFVVKLGSSRKDLSKLIFRIATGHPFHSLWHILFFYCGSSTPEKEEEARGILDTLKKYQHVATKITAVQTLREAYIKELETVGKSAKNEQITLQVLNTLDKRGVGLHNICDPCLTIPICPNKDYEFIPKIAKFHSTARICDGKSKPVKLKCEYTDGTCGYQILKKSDDLRFDMVAQQLYGICNTLFNHNVQTRKRGIFLKTYNVVPLGPKIGLIQFVDNLVPLGTEVSSCHRKIVPLQNFEQMTSKFIELQGDGKKPKQKNELDRLERNFVKMCDSITPCLHYSFLSRFPSPKVWLEAQRIFTKTTASNSMAGYIIGLGDRHCSNILLDTTTMSAVHIDFGMMFEFGLGLPVPELVPFRLTREMVDGMGITGFEGEFTHHCIATMTTLQHNKEVIEGILEAFVHDPVADWTIVDRKMQAQLETNKSDESATNNVKSADANRALIRVHEKLKGFEDNEKLRVEGQVQKLIHASADPRLLCRMFSGWMPWC